MANKAKIRYLPTFYHDLLGTVSYIGDVLMNPDAANKLLSDIEDAILKRSENPTIYVPYRPQRELKKTYYRIKAKNYFVFYSVENGIMEISRLIYARRNILV